MGFLIFIQQLAAVVLILLVLMHSAKADGIAGIGGQANIYGAGAQQEMEKGLDKVTVVISLIFVAMSLFISWKA